MESLLKGLVIGYGSIGKRHINNLSNLAKNEIIVCTKRKNDGFLKSKKCIIVDSIEMGLARRPNFAIISNVTDQHIEAAIKIANSGIDFLIEKPISVNNKETKTLLNIVKKKKNITLVGCNLRFHPCIKKIKEIIDSGKIGKIFSVIVENGSYLPKWHPYEDYTKSYIAKERLSGGIILSLIHEIDYLYWFFGDVKEIFSITEKLSDLKISSTDFSSMILKFNKNIIATINLNYFEKPAYRSCKIVGSHGTIYWNSNDNIVTVYDSKKEKWKKQMQIKKFDSNLMYLDELSYFLTHVAERKKTFNDVQNGIKVLKIGLAAKKSSKMKKVIKIQ